MKSAFISLLFMSWLSAYSQITLSFQEKASLPSRARVQPTCFVIDSNLYVIGGVDSALNYLTEVWTYSIKTDTWQRLQDFPGGLSNSAGSFVINGKGYLLEGADQFTLTTWIWEYTPATDTWQRKADFPGGITMEQTVCFTYQGLGYMGLGNGNTDQRGLWRYDPAQDQWTQLSPIPAQGRNGSGVVIKGNFVYLMGGSYLHPSDGTSSEMWRYNIINDTWLQMQDVPGLSQTYGVAWGFGDHIISGFGFHVDSATFVSFMQPGKYIYDINSDSWQTLVIQGFLDSVTKGYDFVLGTSGFHFGGIGTNLASYSLSKRLWTFDASALGSAGIAETDGMSKLILYPNPFTEGSTLTISSLGEGTITWTNSLGQTLCTSDIHEGDNIISIDHLHTGAGIVFYSAQLRQGTVNGKLVIGK